MKRWIFGLCALLCTTSLVGCGSTALPDPTPAAVDSPVAGKKVAYIMQMAPSDIFQMWSQSAQETAEGLGMEYDAFFCGGSDAQWQDTISQCAAAGYDGLLLSHGGQNYAYTFLKDLLEQYPDLKIATFDTQFKDSSGQTATLAKYQPGEIDAIWCCYDLYASGVYTALTQGGYDIPMVSVDICNADIEKMAREGSPWKACATTNWNYNGEFGMRVLALELSGDYDAIIDPMTGETASWLELPTTVVTQDMVSGGGINVTNLDTVAGDSYTDRSWMPTTDWMAELLGD